jgi:hypothetical protein
MSGAPQTWFGEPGEDYLPGRNREFRLQYGSRQEVVLAVGKVLSDRLERYAIEALVRIDAIG